MSARGGDDRVDDRHRPQVALAQHGVGMRCERVRERLQPLLRRSTGPLRRDGHRTVRGARSRRRAPRAGRTPTPNGPIPSSRPATGRSARPAARSAPRAARRRCRSRPRASPRSRGRSRGGAASASGHSSTVRTASRRIRSSTACRSRFSVSSSAASRPAVSASSVSTSSSATSGRPSRPAALIRGPSRNPTAAASTAAGST